MTVKFTCVTKHVNWQAYKASSTYRACFRNLVTTYEAFKACIRFINLYPCSASISMPSAHIHASQASRLQKKAQLIDWFIKLHAFQANLLTVSTHRLQRLCFAPSNGMEYMFLPTTLPIACHNTGWRQVPLFIQTLRRMGKGRKSNPQPNCMFFKVCHSFAVLCERFPVIEFSGDGLKSVASFVTI